MMKTQPTHPATMRRNARIPLHDPHRDRLEALKAIYSELLDRDVPTSVVVRRAVALLHAHHGGDFALEDPWDFAREELAELARAMR